jgi:hypothetical protein
MTYCPVNISEIHPEADQKGFDLFRGLFLCCAETAVGFIAAGFRNLEKSRRGTPGGVSALVLPISVQKA